MCGWVCTRWWVCAYVHKHRVLLLPNKETVKAGPIAERSKSYADLDRGRGDPGSNPVDGELSQSHIACFDTWQ